MYEPKRAVAASTAVAIAIPLVMALVVLPTASNSVSACAPAPCTSPDISAMPWALSETGPKVSIATITPTVVSKPQPARAMANRPTTPEPPSRNAPYTAAAMTIGGVDRRLQPDRNAGEHDCCRASQRGLADIVDRAILGAGVVAGQAEDENGQHDANSDRADGDDPRIVDQPMDRVRHAECSEGGRQVGEGGDRHQHRRDGCREIERAVDGLESVLALSWPGQEDTDDGGDDPDCRHDQREH